ncbi:hypothetical protein SASPL_137270 [Salvia splendens]|uniref:HMA domain-containing protein n=1 Tax=Salvia splendens TaxID=180675 RepID=A0A8X8ZDX1_SALSN|nr:heavy metal-associated isoprenylated plant protein 39-like [Salvia splendens]KAG6400439.1 hypothetical protein SASPL_137270 [Salvia splendens]
MKILVLKLNLEEDRDKRRALKTVATLSGIDEITIDMKQKTIMVVGTVDPLRVVSKLRKKNWEVAIVSVGPPKEPEKKEEAKKDEAKKEEEAKKDEEKKAEPEPVVGTVMPFRLFYPQMNTYYYANHSMEENPNACVIS